MCIKYHIKNENGVDKIYTNFLAAVVSSARSDVKFTLTCNLFFGIYHLFLLVTVLSLAVTDITYRQQAYNCSYIFPVCGNCVVTANVM